MFEKVMFLDIDGVLTNLTSLNSEKTLNSSDLSSISSLVSQGWYEYDQIVNDSVLKHIKSLVPELIQNINKVISITGAKIIISSTWRILYTVPQLTAILQSKGLVDIVYGRTPRNGSMRGHEIQEWLDHHHEVRNFVIIDDDDDMDHLDKYLVQTSFSVGFTYEFIEKTVDILNGNH